MRKTQLSLRPLCCQMYKLCGREDAPPTTKILLGWHFLLERTSPIASLLHSGDELFRHFLHVCTTRSSHYPLFGRYARSRFRLRHADMRHHQKVNPFSHRCNRFAVLKAFVDKREDFVLLS